MSKRIPLYGKRGEGKFTIVDDEDFEWLSQYRWNVNGAGYVCCKYGFMHRIVLGVQGDTSTDHINNNKLDNRKINLQTCSHSQNNMRKKKYKNNETPYKGINLVNGKWKVKIVVNRKPINLGTFPIEFEEYAAKVYDAAARVVHGRFAELNFPDRNDFPNFDLDEYLRIVRKKSSKYHGVSYTKLERKWKAAVVIKGQKHFLGTFSDEIGAAIAVDLCCIKNNVYLNKLNFPQSNYENDL